MYLQSVPRKSRILGNFENPVYLYHCHVKTLEDSHVWCHEKYPRTCAVSIDFV